MVGERGLAAMTVRRYENTARRFLQEQASADGVFEPAALTGVDINVFLLRECGRVSAGSAKGRVAELRSILRFLYLQGITPLPLGTAVPPGGGWRFPTLPPPTMTAADVQRGLDRFRRVVDVIDRVPGLGARAAHVKQDLRDAIANLVPADRASRFWSLYELVRGEEGVVNFPETLRRFRRAFPDETHAEDVDRAVGAARARCWSGQREHAVEPGGRGASEAGEHIADAGEQQVRVDHRQDRDARVARAQLDSGVIRVIAQFGNLDGLDRSTQLTQHIAQQIVGHRSLRLNTLDLRRH